MSDIILKQFEARSFAGIDHDNPVIIDFTEARKNSGVTMIKGDQGTRKSSTLMAIMALMGAAFNFDSKNLVNKKDDTISVDMKFSHDGADYHVLQSGSRLTLKRHYKETNRWIPEGTPKETLRKIFGNLGVSPIFLKDLPGKKQIEWFKETFGTPDDVSHKEEKLIYALELTKTQRRDVNRELKTLKGSLDANEMYNNYEKNLKRFAKMVSGEEEKEKLKELSTKKQEYDRAVAALEQLRDNDNHYEKMINDAEERLSAMKKARVAVVERIADGDRYIKENKGISKQYDDANKAWLNIGKILAEQAQWKDTLAKEKEYNEMLEQSHRADGVIDELRKDLLFITSTYLPKIPGLEIRLKVNSIDNGDEDEGIFYQGKSLAQLSESELWDLFILIWEDKGVRFVFCENISSLGSAAVATMNRLVKEKKARVFASEMDRSKKSMSITFESKI